MENCLTYKWIFIFVCFLYLSFGCESLWNAGNRESLKNDIGELRLKNGGAFEYFILICDPSSGDGCIQVSYSYG
jgi:hypothetical protein